MGKTISPVEPDWTVLPLIRVESASGESYEIRNRQALCRCGASSNKPFCDGSHASIKFQDGL